MTLATSTRPDPIRVFFLGSGALGIPSLRRLVSASEIELVGIATQPDKPSGRHQHLHSTPIGQWCHDAGVAVQRPANVNDPGFVAALGQCRPELVVVISFGQILRQPLLELAPYGCLNVHASLLPRHRGASPIQAAILAGDSETGICFMRMDAGLDTGPVYRCRSVPLDGTETDTALEATLAEVAVADLVDCVVAVCRHQLAAVPQASDGASYARKIRKEQGRVDWRADSHAIARQVRAFTAWPRAFFCLPAATGAGKRIQITRAAAVAATQHGFAPGQVVQADKHGWTVACGTGMLHIFSVIPEGRHEMTSEEFLRGARLAPGMVLPLDGPH